MRGGSFEQLVSPDEQGQRHLDAERRRALQVDQKLDLGRLLNREIGRADAFENPVDVEGRSADGLDGHPLAGLQQRLEIAKHPRPPAATLRGVAATRHHAGNHRRTSDVVDYGDRAHTTLALVESRM